MTYYSIYIQHALKFLCVASLIYCADSGAITGKNSTKKEVKLKEPLHTDKYRVSKLLHCEHGAGYGNV